MPDPAAVQREGPAYRYPQAGWIVLHVEGEPYDRGMQQGKLLWREIEDYIRCFAVQRSSRSPMDAWGLMRTMTDALIVRRYDPELLEEMKGIADGAAAAGAKFFGRAVDLTDIVAINTWPELMSLDDALRAQPNGLEGKNFEKEPPGTLPATKASRCSAFAATGSATKDGKAIIGHITMFDLYPCNFFNVWIDVKPAKGRRVVFQGAPGSVQSGMDWYMNDAGMVLTETTIGQTRFEPSGLSMGSRSRRAMQYGDSIDAVVKILGEDGNGLYTNEWLLADMKTNEIALYELGTKTSRLMRSSKNEWFGGTTGFYWGCNNTKDLAVRMETIPANNERPADMTFWPADRDMAWVQLYQQYKGKIDADFGRVAFSKPPLVSRNSCDAKYATADMALELKSFAIWGDPYGQLWEPTHQQLVSAPAVRPIVPNDWTVLTTTAPADADETAAKAGDLEGGDAPQMDSGEPWGQSQSPPAWHGTILPVGNGDLWLASAFARFNDYASRENEMLKDRPKRGPATREAPENVARDAGLSPDDRDELAGRLFSFRLAAMSEGMSRQSVPLRKLISDPSDDTWMLSAAGRGGMLLAELRRRMGAEEFDAAMDAFGREHAGQAVTSDMFAAAMTQAAGPELNDFFAHWLDAADALPTLELASASSEESDSGFIVTGEVVSHGPCPPKNVDVTVETENGEKTGTFDFDSDHAKFKMNSHEKVSRVIVNKYGRTPCSNGWNWGSQSYKRDLDHTLIIYGTRVEAVGNHIAAEEMRKAIINHWDHTAVEIKSDTEVVEQDLSGRHLLLVGRPECSALIEKLSGSLPVTFGRRSFIVRGQTYASADSAVIAAAANPLDVRFSMVCVAGLSPAATLHAARLLHDSAPVPVKVVPAHGRTLNIVPPAPELSRELSSDK